MPAVPEAKSAANKACWAKVKASPARLAAARERSRKWRRNKAEKCPEYRDVERKRSAASKARRTPERKREEIDTLLKKQARRRYWIGRYKVAKSCSHCGFNAHARCLDFHHTDPAEKDTTPASMLSYSLPRIIREIRKCVVLCANCHRLEHARLRCEAANDN